MSSLRASPQLGCAVNEKYLRSLLKFVLVVFISIVALLQNPLRAKADKTVVTWFIGLGHGLWPEQQIQVQNEVARRFNESQTEIELRLEFGIAGSLPPEILETDIEMGHAPDIVGPASLTMVHRFPRQWLDLTPLIEKYEYDLSQFPPNLVEMYRENGRLVAIPFAVSPSLIYYNADLFDKANLEYPPTKFGETYMLDGKEVEWSWDTVAEIAKRMTLDVAGNKPTSPQFLPDQIAQFGFVPVSYTICSDFSAFGGAPLVDEQGKVEIPQHWREAAQWLHSGIRKDHFIPNEEDIDSVLNKPFEFASGRVAMVRSMLWYACCLEDMKFRRDLAVMPSYNGTTYVPIDAYTFHIHKNTKNPDAAFKVLQYILGDAAAELLTVYDSFPARPDLQDDLIKLFRDKAPDVKNWHLASLSLEYTVVQGHEALVPNFKRVQKRFEIFSSLLYSSLNIDLDAELDKLEADLQQIVDER